MKCSTSNNIVPVFLMVLELQVRLWALRQQHPKGKNLQRQHVTRPPDVSLGLAMLLFLVRRYPYSLVKDRVGKRLHHKSGKVAEDPNRSRGTDTRHKPTLPQEGSSAENDSISGSPGAVITPARHRSRDPEAGAPFGGRDGEAPRTSDERGVAPKTPGDSARPGVRDVVPGSADGSSRSRTGTNVTPGHESQRTNPLYRSVATLSRSTAPTVPVDSKVRRGRSVNALSATSPQVSFV